MSDEHQYEDMQQLYETVVREEEFEYDKQKAQDNLMFLDIISRRVVDKRRRQTLILNYFGGDYDRENFGDC